MYTFFHVLAQILLTTKEAKPKYYHQKGNITVASQVTERLKI